MCAACGLVDVWICSIHGICTECRHSGGGGGMGGKTGVGSGERDQWSFTCGGVN
jgi:hypothetical protein